MVLVLVLVVVVVVVLVAGGREWQGSDRVSIVCKAPAKSAKFKTHAVDGGGGLYVPLTFFWWDRVAATD